MRWKADNYKIKIKLSLSEFKNKNPPELERQKHIKIFKMIGEIALTIKMVKQSLQP